jgi:hypothetical protein
VSAPIDSASDGLVRIHRFTDPQLFLDRCGEWLLQSELQNSTMLAVLDLVIKGPHPFEQPFYMATIENDEGIVGCAIRTPPDSLLLTGIPVDAVRLLATDIATVYDGLPGVTGMEPGTTAFAKQWQQQREGTFTTSNWCWYALEKVVLPNQPASGSLRLAEESDLDLIHSWAPIFAAETDTLSDVAAFYERRVESRSLYLWQDGEPRSVVAVSAMTPNSIRISGVFTAQGCRRNGYATIAVASVSQLMLDAGHRFCALFANQSDPNANQIYQDIGYVQIFNNVNIHLSV